VLRRIQETGPKRGRGTVGRRKLHVYPPLNIVMGMIQSEIQQEGKEAATGLSNANKSKTFRIRAH
jgi:hypothetical protein